MKPETRARTSTRPTASNRPVYSSHSVITFCSGLATVTGGGGGAGAATGLLSQPASKAAVSSRELKGAKRIMAFCSDAARMGREWVTTASNAASETGTVRLVLLFTFLALLHESNLRPMRKAALPRILQKQYGAPAPTL